jgi:hypothetical protein
MNGKLRVAVVFFGQPRFVSSKLAAFSHRYHLRKYNVSYFGHVWFDKELSQVQTAPWANLGEINLAQNSIEILTKSYPRIILSIDKPKIFQSGDLIASLHLEDDEVVSEILRKEIENIPNTLSQFYSLHQALELFEKSNKDFDFLIVSRYDNFIWNLPNLKEISNEVLTISDHHPNFPDLIYISKPQNLSFLNCYPFLHQLCMGSRELSAESIKFRAFEEANIGVELNATSMDVSILRSENFRITIWNLISNKLRRTLQIRTRFRILASLLSNRL